jgi:hypothetical protein
MGSGKSHFGKGISGGFSVLAKRYPTLSCAEDDSLCDGSHFSKSREKWGTRGVHGATLLLVDYGVPQRPDSRNRYFDHIARHDGAHAGRCAGGDQVAGVERHHV